MIRYYHNERFLGYAVGIHPFTGSIVVVTDNNELKSYRMGQITHKVVGETVLDERTAKFNSQHKTYKGLVG